ncbi:HNH endonuclease [Alcaligenaceae bacterium 429]|nr:HNH endonuclease [Alcaligenaceae bacterium 429]
MEKAILLPFPTISKKVPFLRCQICFRDFHRLRFNTGRIKICKLCVRDLNSYSEPAEYSIQILKSRLEKGLTSRLISEIENRSGPRKKQIQAMRNYNNLESILEREMPKWLKKIAASPSLSQEHKALRAHNRGLLHLSSPNNFQYSGDWQKRARRIKRLDNGACHDCHTSDIELHTHHIIYKSNFGTDRQENLVTLCRTCHEKEHGREFDKYESPPSTESLNHAQAAITLPHTPPSIDAHPQEYINQTVTIIEEKPTPPILSSIDQNDSKNLNISPLPSLTTAHKKETLSPINSSKRLNKQTKGLMARALDLLRSLFK